MRVFLLLVIGAMVGFWAYDTNWHNEHYKMLEQICTDVIFK